MIHLPKILIKSPMGKPRVDAIMTSMQYYKGLDQAKTSARLCFKGRHGEDE